MIPRPRKNLPPDWREMNLNELFETPAGDDVGSAEVWVATSE